MFRLALTAGLLTCSAALAADPTPEVKDTAERFVATAVADPKAAEGKYKGKIVELTGTVSGSGPLSTPRGFTLSAGKLKPTDPFGLFVDCDVPKDQRDAAWLLGRGQKVQVTGKLKSVETSKIVLEDCVCKELEPNPIQKVTANELSEAYTKDAEGAAKKYGGNYVTTELFVEGTIASTTKAKFGTTVGLESPAKLPVQVQVNDDLMKGLKKGDKVTMKVQNQGVNTQGKFALSATLILKDKK